MPQHWKATIEGAGLGSKLKTQLLPQLSLANHFPQHRPQTKPDP